jgi:hypothetical protein
MTGSGRQRRRWERARARQAAGTAYELRHDQAPGVYRGDRLAQHAPGEHVWIIAATYRVGEAEIVASADPDVPVLMDREALAYVSPPGCWRCEQVYSTPVAARPCPGEPR